MELLFILLLSVASAASAQTLRQQADRAGVFVSAAIRPAQLNEVAYASTLAREFNMLEPENDLNGPLFVLMRRLSTSRRRTRPWASPMFTE
jgi:hypothetical protein